MKTTLYVMDIIWAVLFNSPLKEAITGGVYKQSRPAGSLVEDVVINCLPINNEQLQQGIANVNIHVPNQANTVNGVQDNTQPHYSRLSDLADIAVAQLSDVWDEDYNFDVQQQTIFSDEEANSHFVNFRIEFNNINISN